MTPKFTVSGPQRTDFKLVTLSVSKTNITLIYTYKNQNVNAFYFFLLLSVFPCVVFKYKKDSVMEVTEKEYNNCNSTRPKFFSNTGDSAFRLDHSGSFYFISGVSGHCEKGQKMIVKVISPEDSIPSDHKSSTVPGPGVSKQAIVLHLVYVYVASYLF